MSEQKKWIRQSLQLSFSMTTKLTRKRKSSEIDQIKIKFEINQIKMKKKQRKRFANLFPIFIRQTLLKCFRTRYFFCTKILLIEIHSTFAGMLNGDCENEETKRGYRGINRLHLDRKIDRGWERERERIESIIWYCLSRARSNRKFFCTWNLQIHFTAYNY